jgi:pimeloyl-ACP methyl ester carboxylesterase
MAKQKFSPENIIIYGKSLGTGVASYLASEKKCKKVILETPYYSMRSMARTYAPLYPAALIKYYFPVNEYLKKVNVPITIFHGTMDEVIPYKQSKKIKEELPKIELITVPEAFHNNLYKFPLVIQKMDSLLAE